MSAWSKILAAVSVLVLGAAGVWHFHPETLWPLIEQTPLKRPLSTSTPVYQWQDEQGNWQLTDEPPPDGVPFEVKQYLLDANILPPLPGEQRQSD